MIELGGKRRLIVIAVSTAIVLTCVIFTIPFNTISYDTIETYYDTETKQEPYTASESYVSIELVEKEETLFDGTQDSVPYGISVPFTVTKVGTKLIGRFELPALGGFYVYASAGQVVYEQRGERGDIEVSLSEGKYEALLRERVSWEGKMYLMLKLEWSELGEVTKYKEVTKYRDVPVTVEKQRTVTSYKKASLWQVIFGIKTRLTF